MLSTAKSLVLIALLFTAPVLADVYSVGYLSVTADELTGGEQQLAINNLTGEANCSVYGLPYGACSNLDFTNWTLTVNYTSDYYNPGTPGSPANGSFTYQDGVGGYTDIGPNPSLGTAALTFDFDLCGGLPSCTNPGVPDTTITSVVFSGQISPSSFCLYDATAGGCNLSTPTTFFANPNFSLTWNSLSATGGPYVDESGAAPFAYSPDITVTNQAFVATPEPNYCFPVVAALLGALFLRRRKSIGQV